VKRYYVTDRKGADVLDCARRAVDAGVEMIQVREKDLDARDLFALVARVIEIARGSATRVLVNDRLDVALAAGADGVHLPADGLSLEAVRPAIGLVGVSAHSIDDVLRARAGGADFAVFGPVFATPGKTPVGLDKLRRVAAAVDIPILGIGGVTTDNADQVIAAGAVGIAGIRLFQA
jgi:thiamine-phosphate pyrophosphorylase